MHKKRKTHKHPVTWSVWGIVDTTALSSALSTESFLVPRYLRAHTKAVMFSLSFHGGDGVQERELRCKGPHCFLSVKARVSWTLRSS